ncbi:hypothetical protein [Paenibacillus sp. YYML68]|nr:hypothetical protein [Paenibacillus sp. YYML68]
MKQRVWLMAAAFLFCIVLILFIDLFTILSTTLLQQLYAIMSYNSKNR